MEDSSLEGINRESGEPEGEREMQVDTAQAQTATFLIFSRCTGTGARNSKTRPFSSGS
jgi:hypothetical protein